MLGNTLSRLLGLVREQVIAATMGGGLETSAFTAASAVPTMAYDLLVSGAISAALVPVLSAYVDTDEREQSRAVSALLTVVALTLAIAVTLLGLIAPILSTLLGNGFDKEARTLIAYLIRLMLPSVLFTGTAGFLTAVLYARQRFTLPAFSVAMYNLGIILGGVLLTGQFGITGLVVGVLAGAALQMAIELPALRGLHVRPTMEFSHPIVRLVLKLYAPVALGLAISNLGVILDRYLASQTGDSSIAAMRFATSLVQLPLGLIATAVSFAVLPALSRQARVLRSDEALRVGPSAFALEHSPYVATLRTGMKVILTLIVPAAIGLAVFREPLIQVLFERGAFGRESTTLTALAFLGYLPGIPFAALDQVMIFAFYARTDTRTPMLVGVVALFVYAVVALSLAHPLGMLGLVLANTAQTVFHATVLLWLLSRTLPGIVDRALGRFLLRVLGAAGTMGLGCQGLLVAALPRITTGLEVALLVVTGIAFGAVMYAASMSILCTRESRQVHALLIGLVQRR